MKFEDRIQIGFHQYKNYIFLLFQTVVCLHMYWGFGGFITWQISKDQEEEKKLNAKKSLSSKNLFQ